MFIDIDHFKEVNDRYGHDVGDQVLKMVATTVANSLRPFDVVARWGGEEFIALLVNVGEQELQSIAERARRLAELSGFKKGEDVIRVTVSIGATRSRPDDTMEDVVARADRLMYQSKGRGRNCVSADLR
jgi:diguanylate cyclase (GGDEF)-like protein